MIQTTDEITKGSRKEKQKVNGGLGNVCSNGAYVSIKDMVIMEMDLVIERKFVVGQMRVEHGWVPSSMFRSTKWM